jgi:hypothetical protein
MPPLAVNAPYDSLATVTQLVRTILADFIQNQNPNFTGTVNTNGTAVTLTAGTGFSALMNGLPIIINGIQYTVLQVNTVNTLSLYSSAGVQNGVTYSSYVGSGDIFADAQNYVLPTVNLAWRKVQKKLADKGHPRLRNEVDILSVPVITNLDPISQQYISWTQFFDGTAFQNAPILPQDFISPLRLWERQSGMTIDFRPMHPAGDGLWSRNKSSWNRYFDWRDDAIYFPGALLLTDLRIMYAAFLPDLGVLNGSFGTTPVPIMRSADALAYYTAGIFVAPRGGENAVAGFEAKGDAAVDQIVNSWAKLQQRASFHRRPWGWRGRGRGGSLIGR